MTNRETLRSLAGRVEALGESDPVIDGAIHALTHPEDFDGDAPHYATCPRVNRADLIYLRNVGVRRYTASIDAAMTLADPAWWIRVGGPLTEAAYGYSREDQRQIRAGFEMIGAPYSVGAGSAGTDPIGQIARALTAASLRAIGEGL